MDMFWLPVKRKPQSFVCIRRCPSWRRSEKNATWEILLETCSFRLNRWKTFQHQKNQSRHSCIAQAGGTPPSGQVVNHDGRTARTKRPAGSGLNRPFGIIVTRSRMPSSTILAIAVFMTARFILAVGTSV